MLEKMLTERVFIMQIMEDLSG